MILIDTDLALRIEKLLEAEANGWLVNKGYAIETRRRFQSAQKIEGDSVLEDLAQNYIALYTTRRALVDLWDFCIRLELNPTGWVAGDVLRLEEIRQIVEAQRSMLPISAEVAAKAQALLAARPRRRPVADDTLYFQRIPAPANSPFRQTDSPREKSNHEHATSESRIPLIPAASPSFPGDRITNTEISCGAQHTVVDDGVRSPAKTADAPVLARRPENAARKAGDTVRSGGKARRRRRRKTRTSGRTNKKR